MREKMITQIELKELLHYDPETGVFTWIKQTANCVQIGDIAGSKNKNEGYIHIGIQGRVYRAHRLAWLYMTGEQPAIMDHINHIRDDNRWDNLRETTRKGNCKNQSLTKRNTSGMVGVYFCRKRKKWRATIWINNKNIYLGYFADKFEAVCARISANNKYGFHENHGRA